MCGLPSSPFQNEETFFLVVEVRALDTTGRDIHTTLLIVNVMQDSQSRHDIFCFVGLLSCFRAGVAQYWPNTLA